MQINTLRLRAILGWLGMLLPWIVAGLSLIFNCLPGHIIPPSISYTYYLAPCITPFMIILGSSGILLICYKGYDRQDDIICTLAGIFALCICLFPCTYIDQKVSVGTFQLPSYISGILHNISAIIFFGLLAYNSIFLFTKSSGEMNSKKRIRNIIYRICGIGMLASFILLIPLALLNTWGSIWIIEAIALTFFGISWLTKSDIYPWLFCDTPFKD